jgi:outer membrane protein assembly factor BamB
MIRRLILLAALAATLASFTTAALGAPAWTTYRHDALRSGVDPDSTSPLPPTRAWQTAALDGKIFGEPLVYGSLVYVATENDTVYALNSATGAVAWQQHLATAVPSGQLSCGDISPTVGITSTPVIDPATGGIYVVANTWNGSAIQHKLFGLSLASGTLLPGSPAVVDPPGSTPRDQLQRAALALDAGKVIIGYGGNAGDCGSYHGWLVAAPEAGGPQPTFEVDPSGSQGAIWAAGNGPPVDAAGDIWTSTGNGSSSGYDFQESVLRLGPGLNLLDSWAPADWSTLDHTDADLGSSDPVLLPGNLVFEIGKAGVGYLLSASNLGGTGGTPLYQASVCSGSWGGGVYAGGVIYVSCSNGLHALALNTSARTFTPVSGWSVNGSANGPPIVAGGLVWSESYSNGTLYGLNPQSGATSFSAALGTFEHFATASAGGGRLFAANGNQVTAFTIAYPPASSPAGPPARPSVTPLRITHLFVRIVRRHARLHVTLSKAASVSVILRRVVSGRRIGKRCRRRAHTGRRCLTTVRARAQTFHGKAGKRIFRLRTKALRTGRYRLSVIARNSAGQHSRRVTVRFRVRR